MALLDPPPVAGEAKTCKRCGESKIVGPDTWVYRNRRKGEHYHPQGQSCLDCDKKRKIEYEARRDKIAAAVTKMEEPDPKGKPARLNVDQALKAGSKVLNEFAPAVMARILEYFEDADSPHHQWALELLAQRILPKKLYEELGGKAAGVGSLSDQRPKYVLQVSMVAPHQQPAPQLPEPRVIEGEILEIKTNDPEE